MTSETSEQISVSQRENQPASQEKGIAIIVKDFQHQLKLEGKADITIKHYGYSLLRLAKIGVNLYDPESFKEVMASEALKTVTPIRKNGLTKAYRSFLSHNNIKAEIPKVKFKRKILYLPPKNIKTNYFPSRQTDGNVLLHSTSDNRKTNRSTKNRMGRHRQTTQTDKH